MANEVANNSNSMMHPFLRYWLPRILGFVGKVLPIIAGLLTGAGLLIAASLKNDTLTDYIMPFYPRYSLSQAAFDTLTNFKYFINTEEGEQKIAVLTIDQAGWFVILDFVKSEIAVRKSERNEPGAKVFTPQASEDSSEKPSQIALPEINFDRIKSIFTIEVNIIAAGPKPLVPPYRLTVLWPGKVARRVYEFISFQEFELDLRSMLVQELEFRALSVSFIAFLMEVPLLLFGGSLQRLRRRFEHS